MKDIKWSKKNNITGQFTTIACLTEVQQDGKESILFQLCSFNILYAYFYFEFLCLFCVSYTFGQDKRLILDTQKKGYVILF